MSTWSESMETQLLHILQLRSGQLNFDVDESLEDDPRSGRPTEVTTDEMCSTVEAYVMENRRVKFTEIANSLGISTSTVEAV